MNIVDAAIISIVNSAYISLLLNVISYIINEN